MKATSIILVGLLAVSDPGATRVGEAPDSEPIHRMATSALPNAVQVHEKVISGGQPQGEAGFRELKALGVQTIISVDGAKPDVATAAKFGLRYVHLPHGYNGISHERAWQLAKAVRDLDGPIYIHCHHGKHRSPAAASVACVTAGLIPAGQAVSVLSLAGTSPSYQGLFRSAREAAPAPTEKLDAMTAEFPQSVQPPPMAAAMVELEHTHDHLRRAAGAGWESPADHPDIDPSHEALLLREHYTEMLRADYSKRQPPAFRAMLKQGEQAARKLEDLLRHAASSSADPTTHRAMSDALTTISSQCAACHQQFRDAAPTMPPR